MAYKYNTTPDGVDQMLAPFGKWKIVSFSFDEGEIKTTFRCIKCRTTSTEKTLNCPNCNEYMKG